MNIIGLVPQLLIDYDDFCRRSGPVDFGIYMERWYAVTALIEAAEKQGRSPFALTVSDVNNLVAHSRN